MNETEELVHVFVNGEEIVTTPSHPFYSPVKGWTDAVSLRAGDILVLVNGEYVVVEKVQHEILEAPITVYNFHVEDYHTYYVTDAGVLVHNMCANGRTSNPSKSESPVWRELDNYKKGTKTSGTGNDQRYYQWDYLHNEIEVYDKRGNHLGAMDPITGEFYKGFEAGRSIKL